MLRLIAIFLLATLPSLVWANADACDIEDSPQESAISCEDIRISHSKDKATIEFVDGFTLFFQFGQTALEDKVKYQSGDRAEAKVTSRDQQIVSRLAKYMGNELTTIEAKVIDLFNQFPMNRPLNADDPVTGGEVPWPIPEDGEKPDKPRQD